METPLNPTYDEVMGVMRGQLENANFQNTVKDLTIMKLRMRIDELEGAEETEEQDTPDLEAERATGEGMPEGVE